MGVSKRALDDGILDIVLLMGKNISWERSSSFVAFLAWLTDSYRSASREFAEPIMIFYIKNYSLHM